jgi:hypothetical protein
MGGGILMGCPSWSGVVYCERQDSQDEQEDDETCWSFVLINKPGGRRVGIWLQMYFQMLDPTLISRKSNNTPL